MSSEITALYPVLGYEFSQPQLLIAALSHRSVRGNNNERLEFLGDSIVNFIIAEALYSRCPKAREGELSRLRASLVKGDTLATMAREFALGPYLKLGSGELKSGGRERDSILADAVEAIIAAIYLDSNMETCRKCILGWYAERLDNLSLLSDLKDAKTRLQEYLQARHFDLPQYEVERIDGEAHAQVFHVECRVEKLSQVAQGCGSSRRKAEQTAAEAMLKLLSQSS